MSEDHSSSCVGNDSGVENIALADVLDSAYLLKSFHEFLCERLCEENVDFLMAVRHWRTLPDTLVQSRRAHAVDTFRRYVQVGADSEVNVSGQARTRVATLLGMPSSSGSATLARDAGSTSASKRQSLIFFDTTCSDDSSNSSESGVDSRRSAVNPHLVARRRAASGVNRGAG
jgi:hypothetical protein